MSRPCRRFILLAALVALGFSSSVRAGTPWLARHGITYEELTAWMSEEAKDYRVVYLNGYDMGGSVRFAALAIKDGKNHEWYWRVGSLDIIRKIDAEHRAKGLRAICVSGYLNGHTPKFAVVWVKDGRPASEKLAFHLTEKEYAERINLEKKNNFMPRIVTGYADGAGSYRFTALFSPAGQADWEEQHDLTEEQYQKAVDRQAKSLGRPLSVTVYPTPAGLRFAVVFLKKDGVDWIGSASAVLGGIPGPSRSPEG